MKLRVHPALLIYLALIGFVNGFSYILCILIALFVHEAGHIFMGKFFKEEYELLEITPLGGMLSYKAGSSSCKGIKGAVIAAAGPLCSVSVVYLFCMTPLRYALSKEIITAFISVNISMFLINLLPVLPLDGGRIVFSVGYYVFPIAQLINLLTTFGRVAGMLIVVFSGYGFITIGKLNFSMLAAGGYMAFCAEGQREILYASAFHTAIQERLADQNSIQRVQMVNVSKSESLVSLIPLLCRTKKCIFAVEYPDGLRFMTENLVLGKLLESPMMTFEEIFSD